MTAATVVNYDAWMETCLVAISAQAGSDVQFASLTETIDIDQGDKDIEGIPLVNGGRVAKWNPEADTSVTLEVYPLQIGTASGTTGYGFWDLLHSGTADAAQPLQVAADHTRARYRLAILWTDESAETDAAEAIAEGSRAIRFVAADGHITSAKSSFTDGILKWTITFKVPAFDKSASANTKWESTDGSAALSALASYTSSTKW
jgi:hypothetical protein